MMGGGAAGKCVDGVVAAVAREAVGVVHAPSQLYPRPHDPYPQHALQTDAAESCLERNWAAVVDYVLAGKISQEVVEVLLELGTVGHLAMEKEVCFEVSEVWLGVARETLHEK